MNTYYYTKTLPSTTAQLVAKIQKSVGEKPVESNFLSQFYLSGGTGLSLQIGHRESEDLDFFTQTEFDPAKLMYDLSHIGNLEKTEIASGTLSTFINNVKLQFLLYPYSLIREKKLWNGIQISSIEDIACTKLQTISMRGSKKDFVDLYFLLERFTLAELFTMTNEKYDAIRFNQVHILKSLSYFDDAEQQPMPRLHHEVSWNEMKEKISKTIQTYRF